jgi:hypothetical protein
VVVRTAGDRLVPGVGAELERVQFVLAGIALQPLLVHGLHPLPGQQVLPGLSLAVADFETLEQEGEFLEDLQGRLAGAGVEIERVRLHRRQVVAPAVAHEVIDVPAQAIQLGLLPGREAVDQDVDRDRVFGEEAGPFRRAERVQPLLQQFPAGAGVVVVGDGPGGRPALAQGLAQLARIQPGFRLAQDAPPQFVRDIGVPVVAMQVDA